MEDHNSPVSLPEGLRQLGVLVHEPLAGRKVEGQLQETPNLSRRGVEVHVLQELKLANEVVAAAEGSEQAMLHRGAPRPDRIEHERVQDLLGRAQIG